LARLMFYFCRWWVTMAYLSGNNSLIEAANKLLLRKKPVEKYVVNETRRVISSETILEYVDKEIDVPYIDIIE
jgi:hypothetical protein